MKISDFDFSQSINITPKKLEKIRAIHESFSNYHCHICRQNGSKTPRYWVGYNWSHDKSNNWFHTFPCRESLLEWIKPFLVLGVNIIGYGKIKDEQGENCNESVTL